MAKKFFGGLVKVGGDDGSTKTAIVMDDKAIDELEDIERTVKAIGVVMQKCIMLEASCPEMSAAIKAAKRIGASRSAAWLLDCSRRGGCR